MTDGWKIRQALERVETYAQRSRSAPDWRNVHIINAHEQGATMRQIAEAAQLSKSRIQKIITEGKNNEAV